MANKEEVEQNWQEFKGLLKEANVVAQVTPSRHGTPTIEFQLPTPEVKPEDLICKSCGKTATLVSKDQSYPFRNLGFMILIKNINISVVDECPYVTGERDLPENVRNWSDQQIEESDACLYENYIKGVPVDLVAPGLMSYSRLVSAVYLRLKDNFKEFRQESNERTLETMQQSLELQ